MPVPALLLALALAGDVHVDEARGFRIETPTGWRKTEQDVGARRVVTFMPPGSAGEKGVTVTVLELEEGQGVDELLEQSRDRVAASGGDYSDFEEWEGELAGEPAPGVRVTFRAPSGVYRIVESFAVRGKTAFIVQRHALVEDFDALAEELEAVVRTFAWVEISADVRAELRLAELAQRCGSEVEWATSWADAAARARAGDRLVLVVAFLVPGFAITDTPRTTVFSNEDVVELVNERFVPLWYTAGMEAPFVRSYGMSKTTFGQALLLVTPDGDVVLETHGSSSPDVAYPFLCAGLARNPEFAGAPLAADLAPVDRAERHVARGQLDRALALLDGETSGRAHRLRARVLRLLRRGAEALDAIAAARVAGGESEAALDVEEAELLMREGRESEAGSRLDRVLDPESMESDEADHAAFLRGLLDLQAGHRVVARWRWNMLGMIKPESRWAWQAAAALGSTASSFDVRPDLTWPDAGVLAELLAFPELAPLPLERRGEAEAGALAWLLAAQRADGAWRGSTRTSSPEGLGADPFTDAITAIAGRALLRHLDTDGAEGAVRRALEFLRASIASRVEEPPLVLYMDYMTWSDAMMLHFLAETRDAGLEAAEALAPLAATLVADLESRQVRDGGWSYYVTGDLDGAAAPAQSISFTTAAAVFALSRARTAGFAVPDPMLDQAVTALERMRGDDGVFAYFLFSDTGEARRSTATPGAVGRGPACELALFSAGKSTEERLRAALTSFLAHAPLYAAEQGKVLMHAGPDGQGCHYLFFDYAHAALAEASLAPDPETRTRLLELVLDCRQIDGAFLDTPILGKAYGTAMALIAFDALAGAH